MGGLLTVWLATRHDDLAGIACINAVVEPAGPMGDLVDEAIAAGTEVFPGIGSDIADPDSAETDYPGTPLRALRTLLDRRRRAATPTWVGSRCPVLVLNSPEDHVVRRPTATTWPRSVAGPVERVTLERSYHVATLDFDKEIVEQRIVDFATSVDVVVADPRLGGELADGFGDGPSRLPRRADARPATRWPTWPASPAWS